MKNLTIAGNVGKDAVTRTTQGGDSVTGWSVAVEERHGQDKRTLWFDCTLWGKRGSARAPYLTKGTRVAVAGELSTREYEGKTYLTLRADQVTLLGGGEKQSDAGEHRTDQRAENQQGTGYGRADLDDEVPF